MKITEMRIFRWMSEYTKGDIIRNKVVRDEVRVVPYQTR